MALRRHRQHCPKTPRGMIVAWMAVAMQALLPFFIAVAIVRAANPVDAGEIPICAAFGTHRSGDPADQHSGTGSCPVCAAVAAAQSCTAPPAVLPPLPQSGERIVLATPDAPSLSLRIAAPYQSRGPPAIA